MVQMVATLNAPSDKPATTYRSRPDALNEEELSAFVLYAMEEESKIRSGGTAQSGGTVERTRKVCLEIQTKGPAPADAQLDPLYVWAVQTLLADSTLPTLLRWRSLHDARIQWDTQAGASDLAVALVVFTFDYYTTRLDPTLLIPG